MILRCPDNLFCLISGAGRYKTSSETTSFQSECYRSKIEPCYGGSGEIQDSTPEGKVRVEGRAFMCKCRNYLTNVCELFQYICQDEISNRFSLPANYQLSVNETLIDMCNIHMQSVCGTRLSVSDIPMKIIKKENTYMQSVLRNECV